MLRKNRVVSCRAYDSAHMSCRLDSVLENFTFNLFWLQLANELVKRHVNFIIFVSKAYIEDVICEYVTNLSLNNEPLVPSRANPCVRQAMPNS